MEGNDEGGTHILWNEWVSDVPKAYKFEQICYSKRLADNSQDRMGMVNNKENENLGSVCGTGSNQFLQGIFNNKKRCDEGSTNHGKFLQQFSCYSAIQDIKYYTNRLKVVKLFLFPEFY